MNLMLYVIKMLDLHISTKHLFRLIAPEKILSKFGGLQPKKTEKNRKKPVPNLKFAVAFGFFRFFGIFRLFSVFFGIFRYFSVFFGFLWYFFGFFRSELRQEIQKSCQQ